MGFSIWLFVNFLHTDIMDYEYVIQQYAILQAKTIDPPTIPSEMVSGWANSK